MGGMGNGIRQIALKKLRQIIIKLTERKPIVSLIYESKKRPISLLPLSCWFDRRCSLRPIVKNPGKQI